MLRITIVQGCCPCDAKSKGEGQFLEFHTQQLFPVSSAALPWLAELALCIRQQTQAIRGYKGGLSADCGLMLSDNLLRLDLSPGAYA